MVSRIRSSRKLRREGAGGAFVGLVPDLAQVFLHVVDGGQRLVQGQRFFQAFAFVPFFIEVFGGAENGSGAILFGS